MPSKPKTMKTFDDLTEKQIAFVNALVNDWGVISKKESVLPVIIEEEVGLFSCTSSSVISKKDFTINYPLVLIKSFLYNSIKPTLSS